MSKYSVKEVRAEADRHARVFDEVPMRMLNDYADLLERIKADEGAVPDGYTALLSDGKRYWSDKPGEYGDWKPYFLGHPPAQAAQMRADRILKGDPS